MRLAACPHCRRHVRADDRRCPFCALVVAAVCGVVVASCGPHGRPVAAVYGGPPPPPRVSFSTTLEHDVDGLLDKFVARGTTHGCRLSRRTPETVLLECPEADIGLAKHGLEITVECTRTDDEGCRALFHRISEAGEKAEPESK